MVEDCVPIVLPFSAAGETSSLLLLAWPANTGGVA